MKSLQEYLKEQAPSVRDQAAKRGELRREWVSAVGRLMARMTDWLDESDQEKILEVKRRSIEKTERSIGTYQVPVLEITLGSRDVTVEPIAHDVLVPGPKIPGPRRMQGRVDLTGSSREFHLYLAGADPADERWEIVDTWDFEIRPFTKEAFEAALVRLFE